MNYMRFVLDEAKHIGDDPYRALLKLMMVIQGHNGPESIFAAADWHEANGAPTWDKLGSFADSYMNDTANARVVERMAKNHCQGMAKFTAKQKAAMVEYLPGEAFRG